MVEILESVAVPEVTEVEEGMPSIYLPTVAKVVKVRTETELEKVFTVRLPGGRPLGHAPGQFVMVSLPGIGEAPISVMSSPSRTNETFEMCIRRVGNLTNSLHKLLPGDDIGIRGPFARGFPMDVFKKKDVLVAAGGLGMAPARSLIDEILDNRDDYGRLIVFYGARNPSEILFRDELRKWRMREDIDLLVTVDRPDESWVGHIGVITRLFPRVEINPLKTIAVTIGPPIMYRFVTVELLGKGLTPDQIWMSFERRMKCAVGKCGHCQVNYRYSCQEGPSWTYAEALAFEEAL